MGPTLSPESLLALMEAWPAREEQLRRLCTLFNPKLPSTPLLAIHGPPATAKTSVTCAVLQELRLPYVHLRCAEYITVRHLLLKTIGGAVDALGLEDSDDKYIHCDTVSGLAVSLSEMLSHKPVGARQPPNGDAMEGLMTENSSKSLILVLDGIDRQREANATLLPALARLTEVIDGLSIIMILSSPPRPLFLLMAGVPHIEFPEYTRKEALRVVASFPAPETDMSQDLLRKLYPPFCAAVYDALIRPTSRHIPTFSSTCRKLWPLFIAPIVRQEPLPGNATGEWDFQRLVVRSRTLFQAQGEYLLVDRIISTPSPDSLTVKATTRPTKTTKDLVLPFLPTLILTAAYLASYTPPRLDTLFFSRLASQNTLSNRNKKAHYRRRLKAIASATSTSTSKPKPDPSQPRKVGRPKKIRDDDAATSTNPMTAASTSSALTTLIPRPFPLDRLISIARAIHPDPSQLSKPQGFSTDTTKIPNPASSISDIVYAELATLERLRLMVPAGAGGGGGASGGSGGTPDLGEKWRINISDGKWIARAAKLVVGIDVGEWGVEGLFG